MEVQHSKTFANIPNYSIEWGLATWTQDEDEEDKESVVRNRYDRADGGFNVRGSSEISMTDFNRLIDESIKENQFSSKELKSILKMTLKKNIKNTFKI